MGLPTAPPLLFGLGARIVYNKFVNPRAAGGASDHVLQGLWQGILLYYAWMEHTEFAPAVAVGIAARAVSDYVFVHDATKSWTIVLSLAVGILVSDLLAQAFEDGFFGRAFRSTDPRSKARDRLVQLQRGQPRRRSGYEAQSEASREHGLFQWKPPETVTDESEIAIGIMGGMKHRSPLEAQVAFLRSRALAAEANRRRCKEEKKWARSQGNNARAFQLSWQIKRYAALAASFTKEADSRLVDNAAGKSNRSGSTNTQYRPPEKAGESSRHPYVNVDIGNGHGSPGTFGDIKVQHIRQGGAIERLHGEKSADEAPVSDEWSRALD